MSSTSDKILGKTKYAVGRATGNKELQAKGKMQETRGNIKDKISYTGEKMTDKIDDMTHHQ